MDPSVISGPCRLEKCIEVCRVAGELKTDSHRRASLEAEALLPLEGASGVYLAEVVVAVDDDHLGDYV